MRALAKRQHERLIDPNAGKAAAMAASRIEKELHQLPDKIDAKNIKVTTPDPKDKLLIHITYSPDAKTCIWRGGTFTFAVRFPDDYPSSVPDVKYIGPYRVYHPNIEGDANKTEWGVCLSLLKEWTPSRGIFDLVMGVMILFNNPSIDDPLPGKCKEAAQLMKDDRKAFEAKAQNFMRQHYYDY